MNISKNNTIVKKALLSFALLTFTITSNLSAGLFDNNPDDSFGGFSNTTPSVNPDLLGTSQDFFGGELGFNSPSMGFSDLSANPFRDVIGGMYSRHAHDGPGGFYGPGGQLEDAWNAMEAICMCDGMAYLAFDNQDYREAVHAAMDAQATAEAASPVVSDREEQCFNMGGSAHQRELNTYGRELGENGAELGGLIQDLYNHFRNGCSSVFTEEDSDGN